ncbi:hypothetical protein BaRGS_00007188 [Batillaria attramentaria]|uniref:DUF4832 domain-containing protein n=1 Tax=Batillaria attramentaria TaxID=370345 RepID=A0ABD0LQY8_9CAEN
MRNTTSVDSYHLQTDLTSADNVPSVSSPTVVFFSGRESCLVKSGRLPRHSQTSNMDVFTFGLLIITLCFRSGESASVCGSCVSPGAAVSSGYSVRTYNESVEHIENPHRGFLHQSGTHASHVVPLTRQQLQRYRQNSGLTMIRRNFVLDTFRNSRISDEFLDVIRHDLDLVDSASFTVVLHFSYTDIPRHEPPYGDASKDIVLQHIQQLSPIFHKYEAIITVLEAGFIGTWGRQVAVRYPAQKMYMMGSEPATLQGVQRGDDNARTANHNACFLANDGDAGTYRNKNLEYPYLEQDTRYTSMGGETCRISDSDRHECPTALKELSMFHWVYLNEAYNKDVYAVWKQQGCYEKIHRRLGYRLVITKAILPDTVRSGDNMCVHLEFTNTGFHAPLKLLSLRVVLQSAAGNYYASEIPGVEVRDWQPGQTQTISTALHVQPSMPQGQYKVGILSLPSQEQLYSGMTNTSLNDRLLSNRADYNVLLANDGVPLYTEGLNDLQHMVRVSGHHVNASQCPELSAWQPPSRGYYSRVFNGNYLSHSQADASV